MAAPLASLIVMMIVRVMAVPVIVLIAVILVVLRVMTIFITPPGHEHLEVLGTVGMVMVPAEGPVIQQRVSGK